MDTTSSKGDMARETADPSHVSRIQMSQERVGPPPPIKELTSTKKNIQRQQRRKCIPYLWAFIPVQKVIDLGGDLPAQVEAIMTTKAPINQSSREK